MPTGRYLVLLGRNWVDADWKVPGVIREKLGLATIRWGHAVEQLVEALLARRLQVRFPMVSLELFIDIILLASLWPWC